MIEDVMKLKHCSDGHGQCSFFGAECPACEIAKAMRIELERLQDEIEAFVEWIGKD